MTIEKNKVVFVNYHLTGKNLKTGEEKLVEKTSTESPFVFMFGVGQLLEDFEKNLKGKQKGDAFDFKISSDRGYGLRNENYLVTIPIEAFKDEKGEINREMLRVGNVLPMTDNQGNHLQGLIEQVSLESVRMDFNHPLAGHDLHFVGEVLEVREATEDELSHGHVHGPGGHHH
jgi:FKBP-type peptidyl-prolyl cis-trans isomerase SlyD